MWGGFETQRSTWTVALAHTLCDRSDSNGEDLEGYAGAGLYESITMDPTTLVRVDYNDDPITADAVFKNKVHDFFHPVLRVPCLSVVAATLFSLLTLALPPKPSDHERHRQGGRRDRDGAGQRAGHRGRRWAGWRHLHRPDAAAGLSGIKPSQGLFERRQSVHTCQTAFPRASAWQRTHRLCKSRPMYTTRTISSSSVLRIVPFCRTLVALIMCRCLLLVLCVQILTLLDGAASIHALSLVTNGNEGCCPRRKTVDLHWLAPHMTVPAIPKHATIFKMFLVK